MPVLNLVDAMGPDATREDYLEVAQAAIEIVLEWEDDEVEPSSD
jgi:hypothetical protein